jgi:hypothetical protein
MTVNYAAIASSKKANLRTKKLRSLKKSKGIVIYTVIYNSSIGYRDVRRLRKSIKKQNGNVTDVLHLGRRPMMRKD